MQVPSTQVGMLVPSMQVVREVGTHIGTQYVGKQIGRYECRQLDRQVRIQVPSTQVSRQVSRDSLPHSETFPLQIVFLLILLVMQRANPQKRYICQFKRPNKLAASSPEEIFVQTHSGLSLSLSLSLTHTHTHSQSPN